MWHPVFNVPFSRHRVSCWFTSNPRTKKIPVRHFGKRGKVYDVADQLNIRSNVWNGRLLQIEGFVQYDS